MATVQQQPDTLMTDTGAVESAELAACVSEGLVSPAIGSAGAAAVAVVVVVAEVVVVVVVVVLVVVVEVAVV